MRQVVDSARMITDDEQVQEKVLRAALGLWHEVDMHDSPPAMAQKVHRIVRKLTGSVDPYRPLKDKYNQLAMELYPDLRKTVAGSADPMETAVRLAIAGNIIDFGVTATVEESQVEETIARSLTDPLDLAALESLKAAITQAEDIFYLGDNAGEIVFDRLLIEQLPREKVTFVVRGSPILNDALMDDAEAVGMTDVVKVIDNGSDAPGTIIESCSKSFQKRFAKADLIIAKGQGNFETLSDTQDKDIFFLLRPKCAVLADHLGCDLGRLVLFRLSEGMQKDGPAEAKPKHKAK
jgi:uncharacterized protein with ATP-grasp and redox domains